MSLPCIQSADSALHLSDTVDCPTKFLTSLQPNAALCYKIWYICFSHVIQVAIMTSWGLCLKLRYILVHFEPSTTCYRSSIDFSTIWNAMQRWLTSWKPVIDGATTIYKRNNRVLLIYISIDMTKWFKNLELHNHEVSGSITQRHTWSTPNERI